MIPETFSIFPLKRVSHVVRKPSSGLSGTNRAVRPQKMARGLKFRVKEVEGLYSLFVLADLRLCFHICKRLVFS